MGRLIDPGLGELVDRYSILTLKQLRTSTPEHFKEEAASILSLVSSRLSPGSAVGMEMVITAVKLAAVNGVIWEATDSIESSILKCHGEATIRVAETLQRNNHHRAELIHTLNELEAGKEIPKEKV